MNRTNLKAVTPVSRPYPVVHAIDVGWGLVKLNRIAESGELEYMSFPAMAIPSDPSAMGEIATRTRDTFDVPVGRSSYEVGRDVVLAQTGNDFGREITDEYFRSPIYEALMKGALRYIDQDLIDVLVVGLPVSQYLNDDRRTFLVEQWKTGTDRVIDLGAGKKVHIMDVVVRPQPLGGYVEMFNHMDELNRVIVESKGALAPVKSADDILNLTTLVVDPGEHTLDWLLIQQGQINTKASGAASDAGRHRIVRAVYEALQAKIGRPLGSAILPRINEALRTNMRIKLSGVPYDLAEFDSLITTAVEDPINRLIEGLRGMHESIDVITMVGGHPERYRDELHRRFPSIPILTFENSVEANVRGYQAVGEEVAQRLRAEA
jgi:plasmid segregation protein ParM